MYVAPYRPSKERNNQTRSFISTNLVRFATFTSTYSAKRANVFSNHIQNSVSFVQIRSLSDVDIEFASISQKAAIRSVQRLNKNNHVCEVKLGNSGDNF